MREIVTFEFTRTKNIVLKFKCMRQPMANDFGQIFRSIPEGDVSGNIFQNLIRNTGGNIYAAF